jgi:hypothetical protein
LWRKPEYSEKHTDLPHVTDKLYHIKLTPSYYWTYILCKSPTPTPLSHKKTHTLSITSEVTNLKDHLYQETIWDLIVYIPNSESSKSVPITAVIMLNATFNNISVISWQTVLFVEETGVLGETHRPAACHCFFFFLFGAYFISSI